jgi:hypothetical protein
MIRRSAGIVTEIVCPSCAFTTRLGALFSEAVKIYSLHPFVELDLPLQKQRGIALELGDARGLLISLPVTVEQVRTIREIPWSFATLA